MALCVRVCLRAYGEGRNLIVTVFEAGVNGVYVQISKYLVRSRIADSSVLRCNSLIKSALLGFGFSVVESSAIRLDCASVSKEGNSRGYVRSRV
jgi:hypothetical protein